MKKQFSIPVVIVIILALLLPSSAALANGGFLLWQIGISDGGGINPIVGADEYPADRAYYEIFDYTVPPGTTEYPMMPGYIGPANVCDFAGGRPCTDTAEVLNLNFSLACNYETVDEIIFYYDRYGSEYDELYFDLVLDETYFARIAATENNFGSYTFDMVEEVGPIAKGNHKITLKYAGGGSGNGHYIDYMKLVSMIDPEACNQPPVAEANGPYVVAVGQSVDLDHTGSYDPDEDPLSYDWEVTGPAFGITTNETFTAGNEAGITEVTLTVDDSWGGTATDTAMVVVYDPSGGFVTGGGWIDSPAGAYYPSDLPYFEGSYYEILFSDEQLNFFEARDVATGMTYDSCGSAHLATITSQGEYETVLGLLNEWPGAVLGGYQDEGVYPPDAGWQWVTGEPFEFETTLDWWLPGEPNDCGPANPDECVPGSEQVLEMYPDGWNDVPFYEPRNLFMVEYEDCDPDITGKATFGFVSKYKKGASVPEGNTEFQFKAGDLNFHSTSYDWLVVNQGGTNAQFKGYGTINGAGNYGFMIWATDGTPDKFRIKIWDAVTEGVVYDNGTDQEIGGGSIVVHKAK